MNLESGMASLRKDSSHGNTPIATGAVLPYPGAAIQPPRVVYVETKARGFHHLFTSLNDAVMHIQEKTKLREPISGLTHCLGAFLALYGLALLVSETTHPVRPWHLATFSVFGISMILLYTASTLFHWLPVSKRRILQLRKLDHIMIFIFIAATYTPFCLIPFRGAFGWRVFLCIWLIAALGTVFKLYWIHVPKRLCLSIYFVAGFFSIVATGHILRILQPWAIFWLAAGGLSYMIGAVFYALEKETDKPPIFGYHELFHLFVMIGSTAHFWVIFRYITLFN
jgi:hemolysin III